MIEEIILENIRPTLYRARIENELFLEKGRFYLAVRSESSVNRMIESIPRVTKISSFDVIDIIIASALPGISVEHTTTIPAELSDFYNFEFFLLKSDASPYWKGIILSKIIAVRIPDEVLNLEARLFVVI